MITRIELVNFMSHAHTVIEPAAGLTVLVGPNNSGKSAVVSALQILCNNENSTYVLRHGERECSVKVETDDGHVIEWRRKNSPSYVIDGQTFDRLRGSGPPEELHQALRLPKVDAGSDTEFDIHFGVQKSPIFLLGSPGSHAARFFASSSDAIRLVAMQKRHREKIAEAAHERRALESKAQQLSEELQVLAPVGELDDRLTHAQQDYAAVNQVAQWLDALTKHESALRAQTSVLVSQAARAGALVSLVTPPEMLPTEPLVDLVAALAIEESVRSNAAARFGALAMLRSPPVLFDAIALDRLATEIDAWTSSVSQGDQECRALGRLLPPPRLADTEVLDRLVNRLTGSTRDLTIAEHRRDALEELATPPDRDDDAVLTKLIGSVDHAESTIHRWRLTAKPLATVKPPPAPTPTAQLEDLVARWESSTTHIGEWRAALKDAETALAAATAALRAGAVGRVCNVCGAKFDPDRVVARAAAGLRPHDHG